MTGTPPPAAAAPTSVLVVDDQELVRMGFRLILERAGFVVVGEAGDGLDAVAAVRELRPDVVLMDIRMPRLDGVEATRRIMGGLGSLPKILVLTTFDLDEYVYAAVRAGASGFLLKDVTPDDLVHAVRVVARGSRCSRRPSSRGCWTSTPGARRPVARPLSWRSSPSASWR